MTDLTTMCQEFRTLKDRKDKIKEEEKTINKRLKVLTETELPEHMEENDLDKVSIHGLGTIFIQQQLYAIELADNR